MKAISIKNPYATQILCGSKVIEYRSWDTKHRGDLLVCSSANPKVPGMLSGYALCVVNLADTTYNAAEDIYEWHLTNVRKIKAFPVKGKLNFFDVDDALIHYPGEKVVEEQEEAPIPQPKVQTAIPQMPGMPKMIDNINLRVRDDLEETITKKQFFKNRSHLHISGQNSDGLGEGFEQREIHLDGTRYGGFMYVSYWHSGDDYYIDNQDKFEDRLMSDGMTMGGM